MESPARGFFYVLVTSICFGLNGIGIRGIFETHPGIDVENVSFWGMFGATLLASPLILLSRSSRKRALLSIRRDGRVILAVSVLSSIGAIFWFYGLKSAGAGPVSLLSKSQVLFTSLLGLLFLKERFGAFEMVGLVLAMIGMIVISNLRGEIGFISALAILFSALIYALQSLIVRKYARELHGLEFTYLRALLMTAFYGVVFMMGGVLKIQPIGTMEALAGVTFMGLMLGRAFYYEAHKHLGIMRLGVGMLFEPIFVLILAYFVLDERIGVVKMAGAALILVGLWMTVRKNMNMAIALERVRRLMSKNRYR